MNKRRVVKVPISVTAFTYAMTKGSIFKRAQCIEGLPEGAKYVGSSFSPEMMTAYIFFQHDSFDEVEEYSPVPSIDIKWQEIDYEPIKSSQTN